MVQENCSVKSRKGKLMDKYIGQSLKEACAEIEQIQAWEDEQFMKGLDSQLAQDELEDDLADLEESIKVGRQLVNDEVGYQYYKF